jgi:hypothetical protein
MRKNVLLIMSFCLISMFLSAQSDTITGWNFPSDTVTSFEAEFGLSGNLGYNLRAEDTAYTQRTITLTNGADGTGDYAATALEWNDGANAKCWSIKFKGNGYSDFKISAKLRSGGVDAGPKYWKVFCQKSGQAWDELSDTITIANDWTTGVITELPMPATYNNPGTTSMYVYWMPISDTAVGGGLVDAAGIVKIDDILVTATNTSGTQEVVYDGTLKLYPNPANETLFIEANDAAESIEIVSLTGQVVNSLVINSDITTINTSELTHGMYFVKISYKGIENPIVKKIIIQ